MDQRRLVGIDKVLFLVFAFVAPLFFIIPFGTFLGSAEYFSYEKKLLYIFYFFGVILWILLSLFFLLIRKWRHFHNFLYALPLLGLVIFSLEVFVPVSSTPLSGQEIVFLEPISKTLAEIAIVLLIAVIFVKTNQRAKERVCTLIATVFWALSFFDVGYTMVAFKPPEVESSHFHQKETEQKRPNIYHIVLDEMQGDAFFRIIEEEPGLKDKLRGFLFYPRCTSNYIYTYASFPSYMTSTLFERIDSEWQGSFKKRGLFPVLDDEGYNISVYAPREEWKNDHLDYFLTIENVYRDEVMNGWGAMKDLFPIWLTKIAPNPLSNEAFRFGQKFIAAALRFLIKEQKDSVPASNQEGREPFASLLMFERFKREGEKRGEFNEYAYAHFLIPHGPYILNEQCEVIEERENPEYRYSSKTGYYRQAKCALKLLGDFLDKLREEGKYENSIIIVHSDTGHGWRGFFALEEMKKAGLVPFNLQEANLNEVFPDNPKHWTTEQVIARAWALLLVKPPGRAEENLEIRKQRAQLVDVCPTILGLANVNSKEDFIGVNLLNPKESAKKRPTDLFYWYPPGDKKPTVYRVSLDEFEGGRIKYSKLSP